MTADKAKRIVTETLASACLHCSESQYQTLLEDLIEDLIARRDATDFGDDNPEEVE